MYIKSFTLEAIMREHFSRYINIARRTATVSDISFPCQPYCITVVDTCRNIYIDNMPLTFLTATTTLAAWLLDNAPLTTTTRTGDYIGKPAEKALLYPLNAPPAVTITAT